MHQRNHERLSTSRVDAFRQKEAEPVTHAQRNARILEILETKTREATVSKKAAREHLIGEGIYTKKGKLRVEFGGKSKAEAAA